MRNSTEIETSPSKSLFKTTKDFWNDPMIHAYRPDRELMFNIDKETANKECITDLYLEEAGVEI